MFSMEIVSWKPARLDNAPVEKLDAAILDMNSLHPSAMSHYYLSCGDYKRLENPYDPSFLDISSVERNGLQGWFFKADGEIPVELQD